MTLCVTSRFICKKPDTSQKARQFALRFYIQNLDTLRCAIFHCIFHSGGGGGLFICKKNPLCVTFLYAKNNALSVTYIYISYPIVLIPNYKLTYDQSDQIEE